MVSFSLLGELRFESPSLSVIRIIVELFKKNSKSKINQTDY